jgi:hypothetical protein
MKIQKSQIGITLIELVFFFFAGFRRLAQEKWTAPAGADKITNPLKDDPQCSSKREKDLQDALCGLSWS